MKITKRQLRKIISEIGPAPDMSDPDWHPNMSQEWERQSQSEERRQDLEDLETRVMKEMQGMGDYGTEALDEWDAQDYMTYLYEVEDALEYQDIPHKATVEYVKLRFPEVAQEIDELFSEEGARHMPPPFEAFNDLVYNNVDIIGGSQDVLQGEEHTVKVSDLKKDDGMYRWWIWGNNLDPIDIDIDATGTDRDGKMWSAEEIFQTIRGGKPSRFRVPKARGEDLY